MTRKLHNTLMATIVSSGLLVAGIVASKPVAPELNASTVVSVIAAIDAQSSIEADASIRAAAASPQLVRSPRHSRQPLAMPFFSFAPRS